MTTNATQYTWAGRFSEPVSDLVKRYTASVDFDQRMWRQDIRGSLAHAKMLARQSIISAGDLADIVRGMETVAREIESGQFKWSLDLEDVHLNIEKRLTALVGDAGKRLHTGRSRNDQVATDIRLYLRDAIDDILELIKAFRSALVDLAEKEAATPMPGAGVAAQGVRVTQVVESAAPMRLQYDPKSPAANADGYVTMPNVNVVEEMTNMISASRAYQTNAEMMGTAKMLMEKTLTIGQ